MNINQSTLWIPLCPTHWACLIRFMLLPTNRQAMLTHICWFRIKWYNSFEESNRKKDILFHARLLTYIGSAVVTSVVSIFWMECKSIQNKSQEIKQKLEAQPQMQKKINKLLKTIMWSTAENSPHNATLKHKTFCFIFKFKVAFWNVMQLFFNLQRFLVAVPRKL